MLRSSAVDVVVISAMGSQRDRSGKAHAVYISIVRATVGSRGCGMIA
jgi:hypothetical protein